MRKLVTFIRHDSALLCAISVLTENILFCMFPTALRDLSFFFSLPNLLYRNYWNTLFIPVVSQFRLESYLFLSVLNDFRLALKKLSQRFFAWYGWIWQMVICMGTEFDMVTVIKKKTNATWNFTSGHV